MSLRNSEARTVTAVTEAVTFEEQVLRVSSSGAGAVFIPYLVEP